MARKTRSKSKTQKNLMGLLLETWISRTRKAKGSETRSGQRGFVFAFGQRDARLTKSVLKDYLTKWQLDHFMASDSDSVHLHGTQGPVWILRAPSISNKEAAQHGAQSLEKSGYARFRDLTGATLAQITGFSLDKCVLNFYGLNRDEVKASLMGLELASYSFAECRENTRRPKKKLPDLLVKESSVDIDESLIDEASSLALAVNIARHYVNLPGGDLNPQTYAESVRKLFGGSADVSVEIWEGERLKRERMNLLLAVGGGAKESPRLVRLRYRPKSLPKDVKPIALVGKGITFDSGGLDIKPSSGMRWMKKDMGGSAAVVALMKWAELSGLRLPLDAYLSLAENAVGSKAFRPGDILTSRNGLTVEIHNTDAEGRLALADALDVAVSQEGHDKPTAVINLATLTGAIKVGLGSEIAGLFSNNDDLAKLIFESGQTRGDFCWRMPLYQPYRNLFRSHFADYANASDGFGGAVTAALFLELFVKNTPWAHLDIYSWKDSGGGALAEAGGNGQPVQAMAEVLTRLASQHQADDRA